MSAKADPIVEIQDIFLQKDEIANMMLDNVFGVVDEQTTLLRHGSGGANARLSCSPACAPQSRGCATRRTDKQVSRRRRYVVGDQPCIAANPSR